MSRIGILTRLCPPGSLRRSVVKFVNPLHTFFGPIFQKEMATMSRRRGTYGIRLLYALIMVGIVSLFYLGTVVEGAFSSSAAESIQERARIAPTLAIVIGWIQFILLTLAGPLLTANAICDEKTRRTLPSLATTPLHATQIIFGKLASRMYTVVLLVALSIPLLLFLRVYGGLQAQVIVAFAALTLGSSTLAASIAIMYSVWHRRPWSVIIITALTLGLVYAAPPVTFGIISIYWPGAGMFAFMEAGFLCPPMVLIILTAQAQGESFPLQLDLDLMVTLSVVYMFTAALLIGIFASFMLRRVMLAEAGGWKAGRGSPMPTSRGGRKSKAGRRRSRHVWDAPVLWRETHQPLFGGGWSRWVIGIIVLLAVAAIYARVAWVGAFDDQAFHITIAVIFLILHLIISSVATTHVIAAERDARSLDVLLATPLSATRIIMGKYIGGLWRVGLIPAFLFLHTIAFAMFGYLRPATVYQVGMILLGATVFQTGLGLFFSVACRSAMRASIANLVTGFFAWIATPILFALLVAITDRFFWDLEESLFAKLLLAVNPVWMVVGTMDGAISRSTQPYEYPFEDASIIGYCAWLTISAFLLSGAGLLGVSGATLRLARQSGRVVF